MIISFIDVGTELCPMQLTNVVHKNVYLKLKLISAVGNFYPYGHLF